MTDIDSRPRTVSVKDHGDGPYPFYTARTALEANWDGSSSYATQRTQDDMVQAMVRADMTSLRAEWHRIRIQTALTEIAYGNRIRLGYDLERAGVAQPGDLDHYRPMHLKRGRYNSRY